MDPGWLVTPPHPQLETGDWKPPAVAPVVTPDSKAGFLLYKEACIRAAR
jgi:hypothetical protein